MTQIRNLSSDTPHVHSPSIALETANLQDLKQIIIEKVIPTKKPGQPVLRALRYVNYPALQQAWMQRGNQSYLLSSIAFRYINLSPRCDVCCISRLDHLDSTSNKQKKDDDLEADSKFKLWNCGDCQWGWRCQDHKQEVAMNVHTPEVCANYQLATRLEVFMTDFIKTNGKPPKWIPESGPSSAGFGTFPLEGWKQYYSWRKVNVDSDSSFMIGNTVRFSQVLTVAYSLKRLFTPDTLPSNLTFHIIGADYVETERGPTTYWEELLHILPSSVKQLNIVLIGPELHHDSPPPAQFKLCKSCKSSDKKWSLTHICRSSYEDFRSSNPGRVAPTLAVAFNCGIHQTPKSWEPAVKLLLKEKTPFVYTGYQDMEARDDLKLVSGRWGGKVVWGPEKNPYGSQIPIVDYGEILRPPNSFYSVNDQITIVHGQT
ncbi:hypothetical protein HDV05_002545 [Chytridiales sp. JEL 0842]|nr:hypothetical protein HDV05_002545 [Chytridiales sp. JEL 0842]